MIIIPYRDVEGAKVEKVFVGGEVDVAVASFQCDQM